MNLCETCVIYESFRSQVAGTDSETNIFWGGIPKFEAMNGEAVGYREKCPLPNQLGGLREHRELPVGPETHFGVC